MKKDLFYRLLPWMFPGLIQAGLCQAQTDVHPLPVTMPYNRIIDPAGRVIRYGDPGLENHSLDCRFIPGTGVLVVEDRYGLAFIRTSTGKLIYRLSLAKALPYPRLMNTYGGLQVIRDSGHAEIYWGAAQAKKNGASLVLGASWNGQTAHIIREILFKAHKPAPAALPNQLIIRREMGVRYLYTVLNGNNQLIKMRLRDARTIWTAPTGVAPYGMAITGGKAYVTNWGGDSPADTGSETAGVPWGAAYIDPRTGATREGSITVINIATGTVIKDILTGLHPNAIVTAPSGSYLYAANGNSDDITVVDALTDQVKGTIPVMLDPRYNPFIGDSPNALVFDPSGKYLFVANGMDNAVGMIRIEADGLGSLQGFIPVEAYPSGMALNPAGLLAVTNLEGEGARVSIHDAYNSHHQLATVTLVRVPGMAALAAYTVRVRKYNLVFRSRLARALPRLHQPARVVPERIGEPSLIRHVLYIIKENRTYDQVLGDMSAGNGDASLCAFGDSVTPNEHRLATQFELMDGFLMSGKCSAEGHQWTDAAMVTDYVEKNVRAWFRSYPHVQNDALVYDREGFIWNDALDHGRSVRIYGEAATPHWKDHLDWTRIYALYNHGETFHFYNTSTISRVRPLLAPGYPGFDSHFINDQIRASDFIRELHHYDSLPGDQWPELMVMALPNDHTAGTKPGFPTPRAMVADNDLALGRIVQAVTHSRFWDSTAILVTEDDSQDGWDHVSAYRAPCFVISPYSQLHAVVHTSYNQTSMVRTIEQILGIPPMNALDATATPMFACFTGKKDLTGYTAVPNQVPLNEMNPPLNRLKGKARKMAWLSSAPQFDHIDGGNDDLLNRIIWFSTMGAKPYPENNPLHSEKQ